MNATDEPTPTADAPLADGQTPHDEPPVGQFRLYAADGGDWEKVIPRGPYVVPAPVAWRVGLVAAVFGLVGMWGTLDTLIKVFGYGTMHVNLGLVGLPVAYGLATLRPVARLIAMVLSAVSVVIGVFVVGWVLLHPGDWFRPLGISEPELIYLVTIFGAAQLIISGWFIQMMARADVRAAFQRTQADRR